MKTSWVGSLFQRCSVEDHGLFARTADMEGTLAAPPLRSELL